MTNQPPPEGSLRSRARNQQPGSQVATREEAVNSLSAQIRTMTEQFQLAMPRGAEAAQLVRDAITTLRMTPALATCTPQSVLGSLMTCAQLGLRPGVLGQAYLLPFYDSRSRNTKAQLVIGYQGLIELAYRSGKVTSLIARTVYEGDEFDVDYGLNERLVHKPSLKRDPNANPIWYYAIVKMVNGGHAFMVISHREMLHYRDQYATAKTRDGAVVGPWRDNFEQMAHKTCVRQLARWMPKSTDLATALEVDESVRVDVSPDADASAASYHYDEPIDAEVVGDEPPPEEEDQA